MILTTQSHLDKLWFTFFEEVIIKFQFFSKNLQKNPFNFKDRYVLVFVKISYDFKKVSYIFC